MPLLFHQTLFKNYMKIAAGVRVIEPCLFESIAIQHEIYCLDPCTMYDFQGMPFEMLNLTVHF